MSSVRRTTTDWSRNSYSGEVERLGDLLEPAGHLPHPGPEQLGLQSGRSPGRSTALWGSGRRPPRRGAPGGRANSDPRSPRRYLSIPDARPLLYTNRSVHPVRGCRRRHPPTWENHLGHARHPARRRRTEPAAVSQPDSGATGSRRRRPGRGRRHHRHLPALPGAGGRVLRPAARSRRGRRGHLVLEPLPRGPLRLRELHLRLPLLAGAVRRVGVAGALRRPAGDRALPQPRGRPLRPAPRTSAAGPGSPRRPTTSRREPGRWRPATAPRCGRASWSPPPGSCRCPTTPTCPGARTSGASRTTPAGGRPHRSTSPASGSPSSAPVRAASS